MKPTKVDIRIFQSITTLNLTWLVLDFLYSSAIKMNNLCRLWSIIQTYRHNYWLCKPWKLNPTHTGFMIFQCFKLLGECNSYFCLDDRWLQKIKKNVLTQNQTTFCARNFRQKQCIKKISSYKHPMMTMNSGINHPNSRLFTLSILSNTSLWIQGNSNIKGFLRYAL